MSAVRPRRAADGEGGLPAKQSRGGPHDRRASAERSSQVRVEPAALAPPSISHGSQPRTVGRKRTTRPREGAQGDRTAACRSERCRRSPRPSRHRKPEWSCRRRRERSHLAAIAQAILCIAVAIRAFLFDFAGLISTRAASRADGVALRSRPGAGQAREMAVDSSARPGGSPMTTSRIFGEPLECEALNRPAYAHELSLIEAEELRQDRRLLEAARGTG